MYINNSSHMTKMAAYPYMVKPLQKSSPEPVDQFQQNLACSIMDYSTTVCT